MSAPTGSLTAAAAAAATGGAVAAFPWDIPSRASEPWSTLAGDDVTIATDTTLTTVIKRYRDLTINAGEVLTIASPGVIICRDLIFADTAAQISANGLGATGGSDQEEESGGKGAWAFSRALFTDLDLAPLAVNMLAAGAASTGSGTGRATGDSSAGTGLSWMQALSVFSVGILGGGGGGGGGRNVVASSAAKAGGTRGGNGVDRDNANLGSAGGGSGIGGGGAGGDGAAVGGSAGPGVGGAGGGLLLVICRSVQTAAGIISADGAVGGAANFNSGGGSGGGGGLAGVFVIEPGTSGHTSPTVRAAGGTGGAGAGSGNTGGVGGAGVSFIIEGMSS